jgi:hypothetical protein
MSQRLNPHDAAFVMASLIGVIVGTTGGDKARVRQGLKILYGTMTRVAEESLNVARDKDGSASDDDRS